MGKYMQPNVLLGLNYHYGSLIRIARQWPGTMKLKYYMNSNTLYNFQIDGRTGVQNIFSL